MDGSNFFAKNVCCNLFHFPLTIPTYCSPSFVVEHVAGGSQTPPFPCFSSLLHVLINCCCSLQYALLSIHVPFLVTAWRVKIKMFTLSFQVLRTHIWHHQNTVRRKMKNIHYEDISVHYMSYISVSTT
jgi:hypothetical protein